jgi:hypothetical protein
MRFSEVPGGVSRRTLADLISRTAQILSPHLYSENYIFLVGINVSFS